MSQGSSCTHLLSPLCFSTRTHTHIQHIQHTHTHTHTHTVTKDPSSLIMPCLVVCHTLFLWALTDILGFNVISHLDSNVCSHWRHSPSPTSLTGLVRTIPDRQTPEAFTPPPPSHRLSNGHSSEHRPASSNGGGFLTPCDSATNSRAARCFTQRVWRLKTCDDYFSTKFLTIYGAVN